MKNTGVFTCGTVTSIYEMDAGENIPWHRHSNMHGHYVIRGLTLIEVDGQPNITMKPGMENIELPPNVWHRITALSMDTIFIHISYLDKTATTELKDAS